MKNADNSKIDPEIMRRLNEQNLAIVGMLCLIDLLAKCERHLDSMAIASALHYQAKTDKRAMIFIAVACLEYQTANIQYALDKARGKRNGL